MSHPDHFDLFALPPRFAIDEAVLDRAYREVQGKVHPDRFAAGTAAERRVAMQWAARANEAYKTLKSPLARAAYLCERAGFGIGAESNTAMPPEFLAQQLEWREALAEASSVRDAGALDRLAAELEINRATLLAAIGGAIDSAGDYQTAAEKVRELMFVERFGSEVSEARAAVESRHAQA